MLDGYRAQLAAILSWHVSWLAAGPSPISWKLKASPGHDVALQHNHPFSTTETQRHIERLVGKTQWDFSVMPANPGQCGCTRMR
jgi:hypothetical protein